MLINTTYFFYFIFYIFLVPTKNGNMFKCMWYNKVLYILLIPYLEENTNTHTHTINYKNTQNWPQFEAHNFITKFVILWVNVIKITILINFLLQYINSSQKFNLTKIFLNYFTNITGFCENTFLRAKIVTGYTI